MCYSIDVNGSIYPQLKYNGLQFGNKIYILVKKAYASKLTLFSALQTTKTNQNI